MKVYQVMKLSNIKTISLAALSLLAVGCTDLDVDIKSQYTEYPQSPEALEAVMASTYYAMRGAIGRQLNVVQTLSSDEAVSVSMDGDYTDNYAWMQFTVHDFRADSGDLNTIWSQATSGITNCNTALTLLNDDESDASAQVRAVRAFYNFILMDCFGDVPLLTRESAAQPDRSPRADVARFIESELKVVIDRLPTQVDETTYGKPTRYMAEALLAKLYLNWPVYTASDVRQYDAATAKNEKLNDLVALADDIIACGKFDLSDSFRSKFMPDNGSQIKDFIYAMPFDRISAPGMTYARFWTHRSAQKGYYGVDLAKSVAGNFRVNPSFLDKFCLEGDERNNQYIGGKLYVRDPKTYEATSTPWMVNGEQVELTRDIALKNTDELNTGNDLKGRSQGYRSIKFYMDLESTDRNQSNDVPIFRYADILLMKAEAILRGATATNGDTPQTLVNQIRQYVKAEQMTKAPTLADILDERGREFVDEGWRRNDLIRFGKFEDDWGFKQYNPKNNQTSKHYRIFPVPSDAMKTNTNWQQNAGY